MDFDNLYKPVRYHSDFFLIDTLFIRAQHRPALWLARWLLGGIYTARHLTEFFLEIRETAKREATHASHDHRIGDSSNLNTRVVKQLQDSK